VGVRVEPDRELPLVTLICSYAESNWPMMLLTRGEDDSLSLLHERNIGD
jgi:hypothetical protein